MILRNVAIRHGRKALAAPLRKSFLRSLSTETERIEISNHMKEAGSIEARVNQLHALHSVVPTKHIASNSVAENYNHSTHVKKTTASLGSHLEPYYDPQRLVNNPYRPQDITLELLLASQAHMGHSTSLWNPANQRYIYGIREGIHIISLEATASYLRRAAKVVEGVAYHGGLILYVGTRPGQDLSVVKAAQMSKGCHLFQRWIPGTITNGDQILDACAMRAVDEFDQPIESEVFDKNIEENRALKPDLVVVLNPLENYICLHECGLANIPTIGIIDTDANPTWVTYPIPANDDSLRCVQLIAGVLGRAGEEGQRKRMESAKSGNVTWSTEPELKEWIVKDEGLLETLYPHDHPYMLARKADHDSVQRKISAQELAAAARP